MHELLELLATGRIAEGLSSLAAEGTVRGLKTRLRRLRRFLLNDSPLPEAICVRYRYGLGESQTMARYRMRRSPWEYFHALARQADWDPQLQVPRISYEKLGWHDALEEEFVSVEVTLDTRALESMLLCALEAYLVPRQGRRRGYEVYGVLLGMTRDALRRRPGGGTHVTRYVHVMHAQPQLSAHSESGYVLPNPASLDAILDATRALYPQYQAVGDFHSHPYPDYATLVRRKGWEYSGGDEASNVELAAGMAQRDQHLMVMFIVSIARGGGRSVRGHYRKLRNTFQIALGDCRAIVAAYRSLESGRLTRSNTSLRLAGIAN